jgi:ubiquinol-cytochrome c reductase cytochrome c subunit
VRALLGVPAAVAAIAGLVSFASPGGGASAGQTLSEVGAQLYAGQCASCHGTHGTGVEGRGPTLLDEGPAAVDFVLRTGRMPLADPQMQAKRGPTRYSDTEIRALVAYAGSFGNGPAIPNVDIAAGDLANGAHLFQLNCAACHVSSGSGAAIGGGRYAPALTQSTPTQVGEAILIGPGAMPVFGSFSDQDLNDVAVYVKDLQRMKTTAPDDFGGAGPVAEGLAAWLLALLPLVALTRWIGTPHEGRDAPMDPSEPAEGLPS